MRQKTTSIKKIITDEEEEEEEEQLSLFKDSIKSKATLNTYVFQLSQFMQFVGIEKYAKLLQELRGQDLEDAIIKYIRAARKEGRQYPTIRGRFDAIRKFYTANGVRVDDFRIKQFFPEHNKTINDIPYTHEEIHKILENSDIRISTIILVYASTGIRLGALAPLKLRNIKKVDEENNIYQFTIYENSNEEYITFCTPECSKIIDSYLEYRQRSGEELTPKSPLIREQFNPNNKFLVRNPRHVKTGTIQKILYDLQIKCGTTTRSKRDKQRYQIRKDKQLFNAFRKFFLTNCEVSGMKSINVEMLTGHDIGVTKHYYRPKPKEMLIDYLKAIPYLTVSEENRLKIKFEESENQQDREINLLKIEQTSNKEKMIKLEQKNKLTEHLFKQMCEHNKRIIKAVNTAAGKKVIDINVAMRELTRLEKEARRRDDDNDDGKWVNIEDLK